MTVTLDRPAAVGAGVDVGARIRLTLALLSLGGGVVHFAVAPEHAAEHRSIGLLFLIAGWAQVLWAALVVRRPSGRLLAAGGIGSAVLAATWVVVHTSGWPAGPLSGVVEEPTAAGITTVVFEVCVAVGVLLAWRVHQVGISSARAASVAGLPVLVGALVVAASTGVLAFGGNGTHVHDGAAHEAVGAPVAASPSAHAHPVDTSTPTAEQRAAADRLLAATRASLVPRFPRIADAERAGYKVIHNAGGRLLHYGHPGYMADGRTLDPQRVESLVYVRLPSGGDLLVGGMYMVPRGVDGPRVGGSLTQWHDHNDLCLDPVQGIAITPNGDGSCPAGSAVGTTGQMLHAWTIDYPGGPFAELDPEQLRQAVLAHFGAG